MNVTDGRQLRAGRVILGMTIEDMAAVAGINRNSVLRAEGSTSFTAPAYAASRIAKALTERGISFDTNPGKAAIMFALPGEQALTITKKRGNRRER